MFFDSKKKKVFCDFCYKRRFFVRQTLLIKFVNLWQRQQIPKSCDNIKVDFVWLWNRYWLLLQELTWLVKWKISTDIGPTFKQIAWRCFELLNVLMRIERSIFSLNFKQFHQTLYWGSLCWVDITCYFL